MVKGANKKVREETDAQVMLNYQDAVNTINEIVSCYNTKRRQFKIDNTEKIRNDGNIMKRKGGEVAESTS